MALVHQIGLTLVKGVGATLARNLLLKFGDAEAIFAANRSQLLRIEGIGRKTADAILASNTLIEAEKYVNLVERHQLRCISYTDEDYPRRLRHCSDAPLLLYYKGSAALNETRIVSIVGTRNATPYGKQLCKLLIDWLKSYNILVVSGLAYGIDAAVHSACVANGLPTVGVLGHGLDRLYPTIHRKLAGEMILNGGLLTEFLPGTPPDRENFPKRNRIIAGMADVVVVIEASRKGGALITADLANSYHRDVYAFPGRITDEYSEGCNFLIKTNRAGLIHHPKDLIYYMGWDDEPVQHTTIQTQLPIGLDETTQSLVNAIAGREVGIDELGAVMSLAPSKLAVLLLNLEMQGIILSLPGKRFKLA